MPLHAAALQFSFTETVCYVIYVVLWCTATMYKGKNLSFWCFFYLVKVYIFFCFQSLWYVNLLIFCEAVMYIYFFFFLFSHYFLLLVYSKLSSWLHLHKSSCLRNCTELLWHYISLRLHSEELGTFPQEHLQKHGENQSVFQEDLHLL